ncbi:MAG: hypothetical protein JRI34_09095 [Deltaproteobacteria bacterium]|nr:hypothetical protein [Deltaproteobacteria bacterium]
MLLKGEKLGEVRRSYRHITFFTDDAEVPFPRLWRRQAPKLGLKFSVGSFLLPKRVRAWCRPSDEKTLMRAVSIAVVVWMRWNAIDYS